MKGMLLNMLTGIAMTLFGRMIEWAVAKIWPKNVQPKRFEDMPLIPSEVMDRDRDLWHEVSRIPSPDGFGGFAEHLPDTHFLLDSSPAKSQGSVAGCTGMGRAGVLQCLIEQEEGPSPLGEPDQISAQYAYADNKDNDSWAGHSYRGSSTLTAAKRLLVGTCHESLCPWRFYEWIKITSKQRKDAEKRRVKAIERCETADDIAQSISLGFPVLIAFRMFGGFQHPDANGMVSELGSSYSGGHCVYINAYRTTPIGGRWYRIRNSWGSDYGLNGECWVPGNILMARLKVAFSIQGIVKPYEFGPSTPPPKEPKAGPLRKPWWLRLNRWFFNLFM